MLNFFKGLNNLVEINRLQKENAELREVIDEMKNDYAKQQKKQLEESSQCDFEMNFKDTNVVSVERIIQDGIEKTLFGRLNGNKITCDFAFYCSRERHNEIVKKFREYQASKKGINDGKNAAVLPTS